MGADTEVRRSLRSSLFIFGQDEDWSAGSNAVKNLTRIFKRRPSKADMVSFGKAAVAWPYVWLVFATQSRTKKEGGKVARNASWQLELCRMKGSCLRINLVSQLGLHRCQSVQPYQGTKGFQVLDDWADVSCTAFH